jgi:hypothetical protein
MSLDDLTDDVEATYEKLDDELSVDLDEGTRRELTMLLTALDEDDAQDVIEEAISLLFQTTVDTGKLDFHLRSAYDVTYDEYLSGMTYEEMTGAAQFPQAQQKDERRYQF